MKREHELCMNLFFYRYEEVELPGKNEKIISPIGFTAIYKFFSYPDSNRARISQFFILPTHQNKGLGTIFYQTVYSQIMKMPDVTDLTGENISEFFIYCLELLWACVYFFHKSRFNNK